MVNLGLSYGELHSGAQGANPFCFVGVLNPCYSFHIVVKGAAAANGGGNIIPLVC